MVDWGKQWAIILQVGIGVRLLFTSFTASLDLRSRGANSAKNVCISFVMTLFRWKGSSRVTKRTPRYLSWVCGESNSLNVERVWPFVVRLEKCVVCCKASALLVRLFPLPALVTVIGVFSEFRQYYLLTYNELR